MKILSRLLILLLLVLTACSEDEDTSDIIVIRKTITTDFSGAETTADWTYDGNKLTSIDYSNGNSRQYTYTGNLITQRQYLEGGALSSTETFEYDDQARLIQYKMINGAVGTRKTLTYNEDGTIDIANFSGNATVQDVPDGTGKLFITNGEVSTAEFTTEAIPGTPVTDSYAYDYDDENNPAKNILGFNKIAFLSPIIDGVSRNITSYAKSDDVGTVLNTVTRIFTYNTYNYPVQAVHSDPLDGDNMTIQYFYD